MKRLAVALAAFALLATPASLSSGVLPSGTVTPTQRDSPVEPFTWPPATVPWVVNPTPCLWDPDDQDHWNSSGWLDAGAVSTVTGCLIANPDPLNGISWALHPRLHYRVTSPSALVVRVCYQPQARCVAVPLGVASRGLLYEACVSGPSYDPLSPSVVPIAGSGGGYGVRTAYSLTVINTGSRRVRSIGEIITGGNDADQCRGMPILWSGGPGYAIGVQSAGVAP